MAGILKATANFLFGLLLGKENDDKGNNSGIWLWLKQKFLLIYLHIYVRLKEKRVSYDFKRAKTAEDCGMVTSPLHRQLESPRELIRDNKRDIDEISFYGGNSQGDSFILHLARRTKEKGELFLNLKLSNGKQYELPLQPDTNVLLTEAHGFGACGLKIKCMSPLKRWKISFNGLLREVSSNEMGRQPESKVVHVRFTFLWSAFTPPYDFQSDTSLSLIADAFIQEKGAFSFLHVKELFTWLNIYEQWGQSLGVITLEGEEQKEIPLWGFRARHKGVREWKSVDKILRIHAVLEDGTLLHMGVISISGLVKHLQYGYIILPNQTVMNITSSELRLSHMSKDDTIPKKLSFGFQYAGTYCLADVEMVRRNQDQEIYYGEGWEVQMRNSLAEFYVNNISGHGIVEYATRTAKMNPEYKIKSVSPFLIEKEVKNNSHIPAVLSLNDCLCESIEVAGGKGCSLALLTKLARMESSFLVPPGIVITSSAYQRHVEEHPNLRKAVLSLENICKKYDTERIKEECLRIEKEFKTTPIGTTLQESIVEQMIKVFGRNFTKQQYAVRSSSPGEDTSETSAAGQMLTVLGVSNVDKILCAVRKCWSSQFTYTAIQYKRQTSQDLNSSIAVVIQEMVPADSAGVMFTCDPVTGNPLKIIITANYGLGESVVSADVEPDTIVLQKMLNKDLSIYSKTLGTKTHKILMTDAEGTQKLANSQEEQKECCLEDNISLKLGAIGIKVEQAFASPRDIEWAVVKDSIYLLQARPVTALDIESEYELTHELDSGLQTEFEYTSTGNLGEVMPDAMSPLFLTTVMPTLDYLCQVLYLDLATGTYPIHPFNMNYLPSSHNHVLFNIINITLREVEECGSWTGRAWEISLLGKLLDDEIIHQGGYRYGYTQSDSSKTNMIFMLLEVYKFQMNTFLMKKRLMKYRIPVEEFNSAFLLFKEISKELIKFNEGSYVLEFSSILSSTFNAHLLSFLKEKQTGTSTEVLFSNFAKVMLNCQDVESADVPSAIKSLAITIANSDSKEAFIKMDVKEAAEWLKTNKSIIGQKYSSFLKTHGHRCFKEFDISSVPWKNNPCDLVQSLKGLVSSPLELKDQKALTNDEIIDQLGISLSLKERLYIKFLVYCAKTCVRLRENGKSHLIRMVDKFRDAYCHLGKMMVAEAYIPDAKLLFYLTHDEIYEMLTKKPSHLVTKAIRRQRLHPKLDKLKFMTIMSGIPKPINFSSEKRGSTYSMTGIPVSEGVARGTARIIHSFKEVSSIQTGDILITYCTDIGWTPYFPLLAGVATEIGGLISHGAVIAREYGLPCVVGVEGATTYFSSGDFIEVDGTKGTLKKLD